MQQIKLGQSFIWKLWPSAVFGDDRRITPVLTSEQSLVAEDITWTELVAILDRYARSRFVKKLILNLETTATNEAWLLSQGFQKARSRL